MLMFVMFLSHVPEIVCRSWFRKHVLHDENVLRLEKWTKTALSMSSNINVLCLLLGGGFFLSCEDYC